MSISETHRKVSNIYDRKDLTNDFIYYRYQNVMKILEDENASQQQQQQFEDKMMRICNAKESTRRLKKILQLRKKQKKLKQEIKKNLISNNNKAGKNIIHSKNEPQLEIKLQNSVKENLLASATQKAKENILEIKKYSSQQLLVAQINNTNNNINIEQEKGKENLSEYTPKLISEEQVILQTPVLQQQNHLKTPEKKQILLFRYQKYNELEFNNQIPPGYIKYLVIALQEFTTTKKAYNQWIKQTKQNDLKVPEQEFQKKIREIQVPEVQVRIPFDTGEVNLHEHEEW